MSLASISGANARIASKVGVAGDDDLRRVDALAQQILAMVPVVRQQDVADVIDQDAVALLGHAAVPCPQSGLHMEDLDAAMRRRKHAEPAIGVAKDQQRIGLHLFHQRVRLADDVGDFRPIARRIDIQLVVGLAQLRGP